MPNVIFDLFTQEDPDGDLVSSLEGVVENIPHKPNRIRQLGLFRYEPLTGTRVDFDVVMNGTGLAPITARDAATTFVDDANRNLVDFRAVKISKSAKIAEEDIRDVRAILQATNDPRIAYETASAALARRVRIASGFVRNSFELMELSAIRNKLIDHTGAPLGSGDMYVKMGAVDPGTVYLDIDNLSDGEFNTAISEIVDRIADALGDLAYTSVHCFVNSKTMARIANMPENRESFKRQQESAFLREKKGYGTTFETAGVTFETYRGKIGGVDFVGEGEMIFFPVGADNFYCGLAPATRLRSDVGQVEFALPYEDPRGEFSEVEVQSNPVIANLRPLSTVIANIGVDPGV
tara:strand:- start:24473 stop:25522 length:1050 start_codon:yes stop_codon:yes gene_type:complete